MNEIKLEKNIMNTNKNKRKGEKMNIDLNFLKDLENNDKIKKAQEIIMGMIGKVNPETAKDENVKNDIFSGLVKLSGLPVDRRTLETLTGFLSNEKAKEILGSFLNNKGIVETGKNLIKKNLSGIVNIFGKK